MAKRPPKPWFDWRESGRELGIVVIGVLLALLAQQAVDNREGKQRVRAAEGAIRKELLFDDGPEVYQRVAIHPCAQERLHGIRAAIEGNRGRAEVGRLVDAYKVVFVTYDTIAYDGANAAQVSTRMTQDELERYTVPYTMLPLMDDLNRQEAMDLARLRGFKRAGGTLTQAEESQILSAVEALRNDDNSIYTAAMFALPAMRRIGPIDRNRIAFYLNVARTAYGDCIKEVELR